MSFLDGAYEMIELNQEVIIKMIEEINSSEERGRRALAKRRHDIYKDGGRHFLIEQIIREFGRDALKEMRLAPINLLKKIVNKRSTIYKRPALRKTEKASDQALVDFYTEELALNEVMQKAHRYLTLFSNNVIYTRPKGDKLVTNVVPPYLYSISSNPMDRTEIEVYVFNSFLEEGMVTPQENVPSASGIENFSQERGFKTKGDQVDSRESETNLTQRFYMFWSKDKHFTTNENGEKLLLDPNADHESMDVNPIQLLPIINVAKDRDNEAWATQGEDMIDLTIAIQLGWTDMLTIAKHQGFSILTVVSEEEPKKLTIGVNRAIWLKQNQEGPTPNISYVTAQSPLSEYNEMLMDLLGLLLTTNDMDPGSIGGKGSTRSFTSGFHALIAMSDNLEAVEMDKPSLLDAEKQHWEVIKRWHNWMFDTGTLNQKSRNLGKFSEDLVVNIQFADIKPLESEDEVIARVEKLRGQGLITKKDALKKLNPDLTDDEIEAKLQEIESEMMNLREKLIGPQFEEPGGDKDGNQGGVQV